MPSMIPCPKCGEYSFHKSHTRNRYEKIRKRLLHQQPYRCHKCGYRSWVTRNVLKSKPSSKQILIYVGVFIIAVLFSMIFKGFLF